jgi:hypothetical protein
VLSWSMDEELLEWYRELIRFRKIRPAMQGRERDTMSVRVVDRVMVIERKIVSDRVVIFLNFGDRPLSAPDLTDEPLRPVLESGDGLVLVCEEIK